MTTIDRLLVFRLLSSIIIRLRSIVLIIFNLWMKYFVKHLTILYHSVKFLGRYIQVFFGIITGNHFSLVNVSDDDFNLGTTVHQLFKQNPKDYNNPDMYDVFHIYLSKILYELPDKIIDQCLNWGFDGGSIDILHYTQANDLTKYPYFTQAAVIYHEESNRIIVAFRGTEPMDLLQWITDASTNFINLNPFFTDDNDNPIQVHAGFYSALGLNEFNHLESIDFTNVNSDTPMFIQLLNSIRKFDRNEKKCHITITGHSLGAGLASLFSYVLLAYDYESLISGVYTYGQPLVGNRRYAEILNKKLGNRFHRWVNHSDIVPRIPVIELPSIAWYYARTPYSDALEVATHNKQTKSDLHHKHYYHSGLRFRIDHQGNYGKENLIDQGPILAYQDPIHLFDWIYSIRNSIYSLFKITPLRSILWLTIPTEINDHFPGDYARNIKKIVTKKL